MTTSMTLKGASMKIVTLSNIWAVERKIYAFGEINLPTPIGFKAVGIFVILGVFWWPLMWLFHIHIVGPWTFMIWFVPPGILASIWSKQLVEGKTLYQYVRSQVLFLLEPAHIYDGEADKTMGKTFTVEAKVWKPYDDEFLD
jgi:hypothetical protein